MTDNFDNLVEPYIKAVQGKKAFDIVALDVRKLTSYSDAIIIASGNSNRQVTAIAEFIKKELKDKGIRPYGIEGLKEGTWVLLDYVEVIIHVFYEEMRQFYDLEGFWADARRIEIDKSDSDSRESISK